MADDRLGKAPDASHAINSEGAQRRNAISQRLREFLRRYWWVYRLCGRRIDRLPSIRTAAETEN